jgi:predicted phosphodiesterase
VTDKDSREIVVISDTQIPYEDRKAVKALVRFIAEFQPDEVIHIGDLMDYPQPGRWSKDSRAEFEGSIFRDSEYAKRSFLGPLRESFAGPIGVLEGNHDLRPREYLAKYAPALYESKAFHFGKLLDFESMEITVLPEFYNFAPGWLALHGHRGGVSLSRISGNTALNAARKLGASVVMGHTHRAGKGHFSIGYGGTVSQQLTGMEVGNLMDMKRAQYLKGGTANWQQAFGLVRVGRKAVQADTIEIRSRQFIVDGVTYDL